MSEPTYYAFTNTGVFASYDGINYAINTTATVNTSHWSSNVIIVSWNGIVGGVSAGGSNTEIQFNNSGSFAGNSTFVYTVPNTTLAIGNSTVNTTINSISQRMGSNVTLNVEGLKVGNTSANTTANATGFYVNGVVVGGGGAGGTPCYGFHATKGGTDQTGIANSTLTKVTFTTEVFDTGSLYDSTNSKWTPSAGPVLVTASIWHRALTGNIVDAETFVYKNGALYRGNFFDASITGTEISPTVSFVDYANGTDYYEVYGRIVTATSGSNLNFMGSNTWTYFTGTTLGSTSSAIPTGGGIARYQYSATAGQTTFSGADVNAVTLTYTPGLVEVIVNGLWLPPADYTATSGTSVIFSSGLTAGDIVYIFSMSRLNTANTFNYIMNSGMQISQQNGTTAGTTTDYYPVDQFWMSFVNAGTQTAVQVASATPGGSTHRLRVTATTADAAVASTDYCVVRQRIEGLRVADLLLGTASAANLILRFGVKAPAGTYCVAFRNSALNRSFVAEYTIAALEANTDTVKTIQLGGDVTGTWLKDTGIGLEILWSLMAGSSFTQTPNSWAATSLFATSNQFNFMGTNSNVFELFDVGLYNGTSVPNWKLPEYGAELNLCKRHWQLLDLPLAGGYSTIASQTWWVCPTYPQMRIAPTAAEISKSLVNATYTYNLVVGNTSLRLDVVSVATGYSYVQSGLWALNARL